MADLEPESWVLIVPRAEARKARLRPGQEIVVEPVGKDEPWAGSHKKYGMTRQDWNELDKGLWD